MKGIDPKWAMYLGLLVTIEQAIGHGTVSLTNLVPSSWAPYITSWCNFLAFTGTAIMTYQAAVSAPVSGPAANTPISPIAKPVVIVAILFIGLFAMNGPASAQTGNIIKDIAAARSKTPTPKAVNSVPAAAASSTTTDPLTKLMDDLAAIQNDVVTGVIADITAADADAGSLINSSDPTSFKDPISHACYPAEIKFLQSLPVATPTTGKYIVVQLFQKKRDFVMQIQAGIPSYLKLGCAALLGDELSIFNKSMALIGVSVAANALLPGAGGLAALPVL